MNSVFFVFTAALALCAAEEHHSEYAIAEKGAEILEEARQERGHWLHILEQDDIDFMVDHIGAGGIAVAGFFVGKIYKDEDPRDSTRHSHEDDLYLVFKRLAENQGWLPEDFRHKKWTFAFSHDRALADLNGCGGDGLAAKWDHVCIIVWKTSNTGRNIKTFPVTGLSGEGIRKMHEGYRAKPEDVKAAIYDRVGRTVVDDVEL